MDGLIEIMTAQLAHLRQRRDPRRFFLATYLRTTQAVRAELSAGGLDRLDATAEMIADVAESIVATRGWTRSNFARLNKHFAFVYKNSEAMRKYWTGTGTTIRTA
jgi:hypothetical protein